MHVAWECTWAKAIGAIDDTPAGVMNLLNAYTALAMSTQALETDPSSRRDGERGRSPLKHYSVTGHQLLRKPAPETAWA